MEYVKEKKISHYIKLLGRNNEINIDQIIDIDDVS